MKRIFRYSEYDTFSIAFMALGFIIFVYIFIFGIEHQKFEWRYWWIILPGIIIPTINPSVYFRRYLVIENDKLIIKNEFTRKEIPIKKITDLIYEKRIGYHYLVIKYLQNEQDQKAERNVEFYNTFTLKNLNDELKSINPNILISIDEESQKYQNNRKERHLKSPGTTIGWIKFALICILIGFVFTALLIGIPYLINPSIYPHG